MGRKSTSELRADFSRRRSSTEVFRHRGDRGNLHSSKVLMSAQRIEIPRATSYSMAWEREAKRWCTAKPLCGRGFYDRFHCLVLKLVFSITLGLADPLPHDP